MAEDPNHGGRKPRRNVEAGPERPARSGAGFAEHQLLSRPPAEKHHDLGLDLGFGASQASWLTLNPGLGSGPGLQGHDQTRVPDEEGIDTHLF